MMLLLFFFYKYFISLVIKLNRVMLFRQVHAFLHLNLLAHGHLYHINMFYKTRLWIFFLEKSRRHYSSAWNIYSLSIMVILYFFTFYAHLIYFFDMIRWWWCVDVCAMCNVTIYKKCGDISFALAHFQF